MGVRVFDVHSASMVVLVAMIIFVVDVLAVHPRVLKLSHILHCAQSAVSFLDSPLVSWLQTGHRLVVVHHINGQKMERYYILISLALSLCLTIPPYAAKQYGCVISLLI